MRHKDDSINNLIRRWGCRAERAVVNGAFEFYTYEELMAFFASALRDTPLTDLTVRHQTVDGQSYDLASLLERVDYLRADGKTDHAAAVMRFGWKQDGTVSADIAAFNRCFPVPVDYIHSYLDTARCSLRGRVVPDILDQSSRNGVPANYVGSIPLVTMPRHTDTFRFSAEHIIPLWNAGVPADYVVQSLPASISNDIEPASAIVAFYEAGVDPSYAHATIKACGVDKSIEFYHKGIPPEFANALSGS